MDNIKDRVTSCFQIVFPDFTAQQIVQAVQADCDSWDSIAAITLVNVIEDEFQIQMDLDKLSELDSFEKVLQYVQANVVS